MVLGIPEELFPLVDGIASDALSGQIGRGNANNFVSVLSCLAPRLNKVTTPAS